MNKRIKKKIHKRHDIKSWNNYYEYCVDRAVLKAIEGKTSGNNDIVRVVTSRKIRKRKILKLQLLTNCVPVSMPTGTDGNEVEVEFSCKPLAGLPNYLGEVTPEGYPSATEYFKSRGLDIPDCDSNNPLYEMLEMWKMNLELSAHSHPIAALEPLPIASTLAIPTATSIVESHKNEVLQMAHEERSKQMRTDYGKPTTSWEEML